MAEIITKLQLSLFTPGDRTLNADKIQIRVSLFKKSNMNVLYLIILVSNTLVLHETLNSKYLLVNIKESFGKTNNVDRKSLIANSFRAGNDGNNKGNPSKGESSKGEPSKRRPRKEDPSIEGPSPSKKKKGEESASDKKEGNRF